MSIHLVLYSNNEPFNTTKRLSIESIYQNTTKQIIIHDYNLEIIKQKDWFKHIKDLPSIYRDGRRDGFYNSWKAFITKEVYDTMKNDDILYYVDSSQYYKTGFNENIDKLCNIADEQLSIAGSVGHDVNNISNNVCNNIEIWNTIIPNNDNRDHLNKLHILNSWFLFKKCESNTIFINEWVYFTYYTIEYPLVTYHHTGDQSIFNILVVKHNLPFFYDKKILHNENKNKNMVLNTINNSTNYKEYVIRFFPIHLSLENKTYSWGNAWIKFLDNFKMDAFGAGTYTIIDKQNIIANFGGEIHNISFNIDYTEFTSTRKRDLQIITGKVI